MSIGAIAVGVLLAGTLVDLTAPAALLASLGFLLLGARASVSFRVAREVGDLRRAQEVAGLGSWVSDAGVIDPEWSEATVSLLGSEPSAGTESPGAENGDLLQSVVIEESDRGAVVDAHREGERTGRIDVTYRVRRSDGEARILRTRAEADLDERGQPGRWVGTIQDVTEQNQHAAALEETEATLRRVLTATNDGWWTLDLATGDAIISE